MDFMKRNNEESLIGNALGFAYSSIFERGITGFLQWTAVILTAIALSAASLICVAMINDIINQLTGFDFFTTSFTERPDGTWAPPIPYFILTSIWIYGILIPSFQCILLNFYDNHRLQPTFLLSLLSLRKALSFLAISMLPIIFVEAVRYEFYYSKFLTSHYQINLNPIYNFAFSIKYEPTSLIIQFMALGLCIMLGILLVSRLMFAGYYIIDKNSGPIEALQASWNLTQGKTIKIYGLIFTMIVIFNLLTPDAGKLPYAAAPLSAMLDTESIATLIATIYVTGLWIIRWIIRWAMVGLMSVYAYRKLQQ